MATYRVFFRDERWGIVGRDDFVADSDGSAMSVAHILADACADRCGGFELWQNTRSVSTLFLKSVSPRPGELTADAQQTVIERELAIRASRWVIADSVRLLEQTRRLLNTTRSLTG